MLASCSPSPTTGGEGEPLAPTTQQESTASPSSPGQSNASQHSVHSGEAGSNGLSPYAGEVRAAASKVSTQFQRDVLKDGVVTRAEYLEAMNRYVSCMADYGLKVILTDHNGYYSTAIASDHRLTEEDNAAEFGCVSGSIMYIGDLYQRSIIDPDNRGYENQVYDCAKGLGVIPPGYTEQNYLVDTTRNAVAVHVGPNGEIIDAPTTDVAPPPFPFDYNDPRYTACQANPANPPTVAATTQ